MYSIKSFIDGDIYETKVTPIIQDGYHVFDEISTFVNDKIKMSFWIDHTVRPINLKELHDENIFYIFNGKYEGVAEF